MIAGLAIAWGIALGALAGGRLGKLADVEIVAWPIMLAAFLAQGLSRGRILGTHPSTWGLLVWSASSLCLVLVLLFWSLPNSSMGFRRGGVLIAIGTGSNLLVVLANEGMPVIAAEPGVVQRVAASAGFYALENAATIAPWLGDALGLTLANRAFLLSAGDILLAVGVVIAIVESTLVRQRDLTPLTP